MKILEFGDKSKRKIILVHGFQSPWQVWEKYIEHFKNDFHIIVPVMSGHNQEKVEEFVSFEDDAKQIEDFVISNYGKDVFAIFGMSMGGVLTATLWQNANLNFEKVIFDGSPLVSYNSFMKNFMTNFYLDVTHKTQKRDKKTLNQANAICPKDCFDSFLKLLDNMSDSTIKNCINGIADFKLKTDIDVTGTILYYFYGTAMNEILAKKSAKVIKKYYANSIVKCFKGKSHCENSLFNADVMILELEKIF